MITRAGHRACRKIKKAAAMKPKGVVFRDAVAKFAILSRSCKRFRKNQDVLPEKAQGAGSGGMDFVFLPLSFRGLQTRKPVQHFASKQV
jgi:hypothetical protein